jgi:Site-specific recombinase XerD
MSLLDDWRARLELAELPAGPDDWTFCNAKGRLPHPESLSQLFARVVARSGLPKIRFHDLRHTHASLLVAHGVPIKVVTERLGHSHPAFTMHTYQHLLPGMSADAATQFAGLARTPAGRRLPSRSREPQVTAVHSHRPVDDPVDTGRFTLKQRARRPAVHKGFRWWRGLDLNQRPSGYERPNR